MKRKILLNFLAFFLVSALFSSCKDKDNKDDNVLPTPTSKVVKYEITGNYSGKLTVIYTNESGANESISDVSIPWSKEVTVQSSVHYAGFTAGTTGSGTPGTPGQTATAKLYVSGQVKQSANQTVDENGILSFGSLAATF